MSELDKYGKHDPMAKHSSRPKQGNSKITLADTDEWLKKNGNGMQRLPDRKAAVSQNVWQLYGKKSVSQLIDMHFANHEYLAPHSINDVTCSQNVRTTCNNMVAQGKLVQVYQTLTITDPVKGNIKKRVLSYKRP